MSRDMKTLLSQGLGLLCAACCMSAAQAGYVGDPIATDAPYQMAYEEPHQSSSPQFNPSQFGYEYLGPMTFKSGGGRATLHNAFLYAHLIPQNPEAKMSFGLDLITRMTWFGSRGNDLFDDHRLYTVGLNGSSTITLSDSTKIFLGASAMLSTDFDTFNSHCIQIGARGGVSQRINDRLSLQLGLYYTPQLATAPLLPIIGFRYEINDRWFMSLDPMRFKVINKLTDSLSWGPFIGLSAGSWNVRNQRQDMRFSYLSGICGLQANLKLGTWGSYKPTLTTETGFTFANSVEYRNATGRKKIEEAKMKEGFYFQAGVKFDF